MGNNWGSMEQFREKFQTTKLLVLHILKLSISNEMSILLSGNMIHINLF